ncbi:MAG: 3'-5' exonuclease [Campylobacterales bacterium]
MSPVVLLDTETTGGGESDRICQIAFIVADGENVEAYMSYCRPPLPISFDAMAVHHITNERVANEPPFHQTEACAVLEELNDEGVTIAIHHAPFDLGMLAKERIAWKGPIIDTIRCAKHIFKESPRHALQYLRYARGYYKKEGELARKLGIKIEAHDALGDVLILKLLYDELLRIAGSNDALIELAKQPIIVEKITFGKYKGESLEEIYQRDSRYVEWLLSTDLDEDLRYSIRRVVARIASSKNPAVRTPLENKAIRWAEENGVT